MTKRSAVADPAKSLAGRAIAFGADQHNGHRSRSRPRPRPRRRRRCSCGSAGEGALAPPRENPLLILARLCSLMGSRPCTGSGVESAIRLLPAVAGFGAGEALPRRRGTATRFARGPCWPAVSQARLPAPAAASRFPAACAAVRSTASCRGLGLPAPIPARSGEPIMHTTLAAQLAAPSSATSISPRSMRRRPSRRWSRSGHCYLYADLGNSKMAETGAPAGFGPATPSLVFPSESVALHWFI